MAHDIAPDGYCTTCRTVPCSARSSSVAMPSKAAAQLDRIEHLLRQVSRKLGIEVPDSGA